MNKRIDLTDQHFGRLTAQEPAGHDKDGSVMWLCLCECGATVRVRARSLWSGNTRSCGCLQKEKARQTLRAAITTHGGCGTRLHGIYRNMKQRCDNAANPAYESYGGRGITVCEEWAQSFEKFRDWALANGYRDDLTLDRKENDGPYSPDNCRWATMKQQANNRRSNRVFSYNGESHDLAEWAKLTGIKYNTLRGRLLTYGWSVERALTTKPRR